MRVVALVSGGKDSCYSMQLCKHHGHDVVALANLLPEELAPDELDSFCFQTVGHQLIGAYAACMGLPLFRKRISGTSSVQDLGYSPTEGDEVEDLYQLLAFVKDSIPGIQAVASGAIASDYQRLRVENVCSRLNLVSLAYLWHQPQRLLLRGMVESGVEAIVVKVACLGLQPRKHLGRTIAAMEPILLSLADAYGCNVCGEGGEYETLTLDCPVFTRGRIELDESEIVHGSSDVGHLVPKAFRVVPKPGWEGCELPSDVRFVPGDYVAAPRGSRCSASQLPPLPGSTAPSSASGAAVSTTNAIAAAAGGGGGSSSAMAAAIAVDPLLLPAAPSSFHVQVSMCSGPDYVQLVCRAVRPKSALPSDLTECDTTAALHALLATAEQELATQHMDLHHCLFVHLFLANMGHFQAANGVYCKHFTGRDPPSRACVQVCLPHDCPVMCELLLARGAAPPAAPRSPLPAGPVPPANPPSRHTRRVLHVQSISSWAPSCIGPYSQATSYRGLVYMAGVIPLDPPVMTLVPGDITAQVLRAMLSCEAVAVAQRTTVVGAALGLTVYLAAAVGGGAVSSSLAVGASGGGATSLERGSMSFTSGGGMELRSLTRSAVEAILEHGLYGYPHGQHRQSNFGPPNASAHALGFGNGSGRYHRSFTCEPAMGTPRSSYGVGSSAAGHGRVSAPPSRRSMLLGADGPDEEEEEEAERAEAAANAGGGPGGTMLSGQGTSVGQLCGGASALDPYLQPPEVRVPIRPSVLYVTVPSLPRGSLVEIQPVCLDVEALAVIRKLTGHDSFVKRRNSSHHDAASLHQSSQSHQYGGNANNNCSQNINSVGAAGIPLVQPSTMAPGAYNSPTGVSASAAIGTVTSWSELPPTPRASLESLAGRDGAAGGSNSNNLHHPHGSGSSPMQWQVSADMLGMGTLASPLPSHMLSANGFMSPEAGVSLAGTPCGVPFVMTRQRSSGLGLLAMSGNGATGGASGVGVGLGGSSGSGLFYRCLSPGPQPLPAGTSPNLPWMASWAAQSSQPSAAAAGGPQLPVLQTPPHPPLSAQNSGHQLLSPTLQQLLQLQLPPHAFLQPLQQSGVDAPPLQQLQQLQLQQQQQVARSAPGGTGSRRERQSSSNGGAAATASKEASAVPFPAVMAARASYSGSSGNNSSSSVRRTSLDGNILSFEVSSGRGGLPVVVSPLPHSVPHSGNAASLMDVATVQHAGVGALSSGGTSHAATLRARPEAITVPQLSIGGGMVMQRSPFESALNAAVGVVAGGISSEVMQVGATVVMTANSSSPLPYADSARAISGPAAAHIPPALTIPAQSSGPGADTTPTPGHAAASGTPLVSELPTMHSGAATVSGARSGAGGSSSCSDVMVTTVCCYGQVLRSLFHLPPAVFTRGVTTAQLTRRFRRATASVLAAHGMDISCLIWVRVWYEKGTVEFTDDEYGSSNAGMQATMQATMATVPGSHAGMSLPYFASQAGIGGGLLGGAPRVLHALEDYMDDDSCGGRRGRVLRRASGSGGSSSGGGGAALSAIAAAAVLGNESSACASPRTAAASRALALAEATGTVQARGGSGGGSPRCCPDSPAAAVANPSTHHRRLSGLQPDTIAPDDRQGQQSHNQCHHSHSHSHQHHHQQQHHHHQHGAKDLPTTGQQPQHFHVSWVPVQRVATNASPQPTQCVAVLELLAALPTP